jgi:hypothetical protein
MCVDAYRKDMFPTLYRADVVSGRKGAFTFPEVWR